MRTPAPPMGWPFVVGRGRRLGYRVIAAPGFLDDADDVLQSPDVDPAGHGGTSRISTVPSRSGHVTVVAVSESVTEDTLAAAAVRSPAERSAQATSASTPTSADRGRPMLDMHSRPLEIMYGFVVPDREVTFVADDDLAHARREAFRTYRTFLDDEDHDPATVETAAMTLASPTEPIEASPPHSRPDPAVRTPSATRAARSSATSAAASAETSRRRRSGRHSAGRAFAVGAVCIFVAGVLTGRSLVAPEPEPVVPETCVALSESAPRCVVTITSPSDVEFTVDTADTTDDVRIDDDCDGRLSAGASCTIDVELEDGTGSLDATIVIRGTGGDVLLEIPVRTAQSQTITAGG